MLYDGEDMFTLDCPVRASEIVSKTVNIDADAMYVKVIAENGCTSQALHDISVAATLVGGY